MPDSVAIRTEVPADAPMLSELLAQLGYPAAVSEIPYRLRAIESFHVERRAVEKGAKRLTVTSGLQRAATHEFYEKRNYERTGLRFSKHLHPEPVAESSHLTKG